MGWIILFLGEKGGSAGALRRAARICVVGFSQHLPIIQLGAIAPHFIASSTPSLSEPTTFFSLEADFIGKECQFKKLLAMKFTT